MLPKYRRFKSWSLPSKWSFISAIFGIPLAIVSILLTFDFSEQPTSCSTIENKYDNYDEIRGLVCRSMIELSTNAIWLENIIIAREKNTDAPDGKIVTTNLKYIIENHFDFLMRYSYLENERFYRYFILFSQLASEANETYQHFILWNRTDKLSYTTYDLIFMNESFRWYLEAHAADVLSKEHYEFVMARPLSDSIQQIGYTPVKMKVTSNLDAEGKPILEFNHMLSIMD